MLIVSNIGAEKPTFTRSNPHEADIPECTDELEKRKMSMSKHETRIRTQQISIGIYTVEERSPLGLWRCQDPISFEPQQTM